MQLSFQSLIAADASREQIEDWCRTRTQNYPVEIQFPGMVGTAVHNVVCRVLGKYIMMVAARDYAITPHLVLDGIWEPWITMAIARHVRPGMRCMDVGACYGYYAVLMADLVGKGGKGGYVEAWEPVWSNLVTYNADANGVEIKVHRAPMGTGADKEFEFRLPGTMFNAGDVHLSPRKINTATRVGFGCVLMSAPDPGAYDFIKIDVEGAEADVWQALAGVRERSPNLTVCMEFTPKSHPEPRQFLEQIHADGFAVGTVGHDGVPRPITMEEALVPDTGDFRMLWLTRWK